METKLRSKRLSGTWCGRAAGILLVLTWLASMSVLNANAYSYLPVLLGMVAAVVLGLCGLLCGGKVVALRWLGWCSFAVGGYFLARCLCVEGCSVVESWREAGIICGCFVFYAAGSLVAQNDRAQGIGAILTVALLLNVAAFLAARVPGACPEWFGRPSAGLNGRGSLPCTLYVYKNFAGMFLLLCGSLPLMRLFWTAPRRWYVWLMALVGLSCAGVAFFCDTRSVWLMLPVLFFSGLFLWLLFHIFSRRKLGWGGFVAAAVLVTASCVAAYEFFFGGSWMAAASQIDTHLRYDIWRLVCSVAADAPPWGYGASSAGWMITPLFNEWEWPNFAHNEYLQAWCDYGFIGLVCLVSVIAAHLVAGLRTMASEYVSNARRVKAAMAIITLLTMACCAGLDFVWHDFSLACMTAFACGMLASPFPRSREGLFSDKNWASGSHAGCIPVKVQGRFGTCMQAAVMLGVCAVCCAFLAPRLWPAWQAQWKYNELAAGEPSLKKNAAKHALLAEVLENYPDSVLVDEYFRVMSSGESLEQREHVMRTALRGNPRQMFVVTMLVDNLMSQGRNEEAEILMRRMYPGDGLANCMLNNWASYYVVNLLEWGQREMLAGRTERAYSMMDYAFNIARHPNYYPDFLLRYRFGEQPWAEYGGVKPNLGPFLKARKGDVNLFRILKIEKDDSWQQPLEPGGKPALYSAQQEPPAKAK